eukprot:6594898-Pyramimonas_sp.AAC.1
MPAPGAAFLLDSGTPGRLRFVLWGSGVQRATGNSGHGGVLGVHGLGLGAASRLGLHSVLQVMTDRGRNLGIAGADRRMCLKVGDGKLLTAE